MPDLFDIEAVAQNMINNHGYSKKHSYKQAKMLADLAKKRLDQLQSKEKNKIKKPVNDNKESKIEEIIDFSKISINKKYIPIYVETTLILIFFAIASIIITLFISI